MLPLAGPPQGAQVRDGMLLSNSSNSSNLVGLATSNQRRRGCVRVCLITAFTCSSGVAVQRTLRCAPDVMMWFACSTALFA
jgi:hypothetical protein